jgi:hypothetical protein
MLDLFSGLGGASEAFIQSEKWYVTRIDNNPKFHPITGEYPVPGTIIADVTKDITDKFYPKNVDFMWCSIPCDEFSNAYSSKRSKAARAGIDYEPDMTLLLRTIELIQLIKPRYWCIENVLGASKYFSEHLGAHRIKLGSALLWGNFPIIGFEALETKYKQKAGDNNRHSDIRSNHRAKIPFWLSEQMRISVQYQMTIDDFEESLPQSRV